MSLLTLKELGNVGYLSARRAEGAADGVPALNIQYPSMARAHLAAQGLPFGAQSSMFMDEAPLTQWRKKPSRAMLMS